MEPIESLPTDIEGLHRGLLWVAREVAACGRALQRATDEMGAMGGRLGGVEVRELALVHAAQGVEDIRRELAWLSAEVRSRSQAMTATTTRLDELVDGIDALQAGSDLAIEQLRTDVAQATSDSTERLHRLADVVQATSDSTERLQRLAGELERGVAAERLGQVAAAVFEDRLEPVLDRLRELERRAEAVEAAGGASEESVTARLEQAEAALTRRLEETESSTAARVEQVEVTLSGRVEQTEAMLAGRVDESEAALTRRLEEIESSTAARVEQVEATLSGRVEQTEAMLAGRVDESEATLARRLEETEATLGPRLEQVAEGIGRVRDGVGALPEQVEALRGRLDELAEQHSDDVSGPWVEEMSTRLAAHQARIDALPVEMAALGRRFDSLAGQVASLDATIAGAVGEEAAPLHQAMDEVRWRIEQVGAEATAAGDTVTELVSSQVAALNHRLDGFEVVRDGLDSLRTEIDRLSEMAVHRDQTMLALDQRTAPLEGAIDDLQGDLARLAADLGSNQQSALWSLQTHIDELTARLTALEAMPGDLGEVRTEIGAMHAEVEAARQAALTATTEQLGALARLRALESMPTDLEDVYRELERVTQLAAEATSSGLEQLLERLGPLEAGAAEAKAALDRLEVELGVSLQAVTSASSREIEAFETRVRTLESQAAEVTRLAEELERHDVEVVAARGELVEQVAALASRLARLDSLPSDVEALYRELDRIVEVTNQRHAETAALAQPATSRFEQLRSDLDLLETRLLAVESLGDVITGLRSDLSPIAGQVADLGSVVAGVPATAEELRDAIRVLEAELGAARAAADRSVAEVAEQLRALESLPAALAALERSVDDVADMTSADAESTTALRARLEAVSADAEAAARRVLEETAERVDALASRLAPLEERVREQVDGTGGTEVVAALERRLGRALEAFEAERADRAGATARLDRLEVGLQAVEGLGIEVSRLAELDSLPAEVTGLHRELEAAIQRLANEHGNLAAVAGPDGPLGDALVDLRAELDRLRAEVRSANGAEVADLAGLVESVRSEMRSLRDQADGALGDAAGRLDRLEALAGEIAELRLAVERLPLVVEGGGAIGELADRVERLSHDVNVTRRDALVTATRIEGFDGVPAELAVFQRRLDELAATRRSDLEAVERIRERLDNVTIRDIDPGALDELHRRMDALAAHVAATGTAADAAGLDELRSRLDHVVAQAGSWQDDARSLATRVADLEGLPTLVAGMGRLLQRAAAKGMLDGAMVGTLEEKLEGALAQARRDSVEAAKAAAVARAELAELSERFEALPTLPLESLPREVLRAQEELRSLRDDLEDVRESNRVDVAAGTASLADAVTDLQERVRRLLDESAAAREVLRASAGGLDALEERTRELESLPAEVRKLDTVLTRLDRDVVTSQQAALTATTYRLAEIDTQLRAFASLRADVDGLYGALHRVAEEVGVSTSSDAEG